MDFSVWFGEWTRPFFGRHFKLMAVFSPRRVHVASSHLMTSSLITFDCVSETRKILVHRTLWPGVKTLAGV